MALTLGSGSLALLTLGVATTLMVSERPTHESVRSAQDLRAPEVPAGLAARLVDGTFDEVSLSWSANRSDPDLAGYIVYRSVHPEGGYKAITADPVLTNAFVDRDAPADGDCFYRIAARDAARNESALSELTGIRTLASPEQPDLLVGTLQAGF
jgi:hypothetical protein